MSSTVKITDKSGNEMFVEQIAVLPKNNAVRVSATTYNAGRILGFRILTKGTGNLVFTPEDSGASAITITAAEITAMAAGAFSDFDIACSSITAGTGMELLVYIP